MKFRISHLLIIFIFLMQNSLGTVMAAQMSFHELLPVMPETHGVVTQGQEKAPCPHHAQQVKVDKEEVTVTDASSHTYCGVAGCDQCQCTMHLNLIVAPHLPMFAFIPFQNSREDLVQALVELPPGVILRPPKS